MITVGYPTPDLGVPLGGSQCSVGDEADWAWADLVIISGMIVQKPDMLHPRGEEAARQRSGGVAPRHIRS